MRHVEEFLAMLAGERNASPHTIRAYARELHGFADFVVESASARSCPCGPSSTSTSAHTSVNSTRAGCRKPLPPAPWPRFARGSNGWQSDGLVEQSPAALVATPKLPKHLPRVPTIEDMNRVVESAADDHAAWPERDRVIFELLYGCGIRNAELVGIDLADIHWANEAILVRGKGTQGALRSAG